jgi:hypothetical protein
MSYRVDYFTEHELKRLPDGEYEIEEYASITVEGTTVDRSPRWKVRVFHPELGWCKFTTDQLLPEGE